ncbi:hypothetical protein PQE75_gp053 [Bacillus phage vB_BcoS-136]|uniref:Uncharacterized protein n=1 Tax=Bacillus phage vB_BcoS-136 TaxID=2419619 RepID=A0A3G3BVB7_9CAUD|nr:hypothetical protein PQE75_gp053 [Bacillus phage vB_BcoS-136]AYP68185.1 hypothetical protein vBBcoS136_00053 [Bacillus phage vB_BcoS-136]
MKKYILMNANNIEASYIVKGRIEEIRNDLKDRFLNTFGEPVADNDPRVEDDFHFISESRFNSVDTMTFEELKEEFEAEYGWVLVELDNKEELVSKVLDEDNRVNREDIEEQIQYLIEEEITN